MVRTREWLQISFWQLNNWFANARQIQRIQTQGLTALAAHRCERAHCERTRTRPQLQ
jgi:hypothetical protein